MFPSAQRNSLRNKEKKYNFFLTSTFCGVMCWKPPVYLLKALITCFFLCKKEDTNWNANTWCLSKVKSETGSASIDWNEQNRKQHNQFLSLKNRSGG